MDRERLLQALRQVVEPETGQDVVSLDMIRELRQEGERVAFTLELLTPAYYYKEQLPRQVLAAAEAVVGAGKVDLQVTSRVRSAGAVLGAQPLPGIANVVAVGSGKGGVGKSTVACNLAVALAADGARVGMLDADIYGPSIPTLLGVSEAEVAMQERQLIPLEVAGLKLMSMGLLVKGSEPVIWRGPILHNVLGQLLRDVRWGELDYMVVDLPPGTGDVQLSLCQMVPLGGAVVVATPQDVALQIAVKAINMFAKLNTPVLGVVENMSYYVCPHCGQRDDIFGHGGARAVSARLGLPFLGEIPLQTRVRQAGDEGKPVVLAAPDSPAGQAFRSAARLLAGRLAVAAVKGYDDLVSTLPGG